MTRMGNENSEKEIRTNPMMIELSKKNLTKIPPEVFQSTPGAVSLDVSDNQLARVDNLETLCSLRKVNASHNVLTRLVSFGAVKYQLEELNVSNNQIHVPEGLTVLVKLRVLNMAHNRIEKLPILDRLVHLSELDLSWNKISSLPNVACISHLDVLLLDGNQISRLDSAPKHLPSKLKTLSLCHNAIRDLSEMYHLSCMSSLEHLSISGNDCVTPSEPGFDYRPYLICCCLSLRTIDGFIVTETEQLKGEWLYSQGRGRQFMAGNHALLIAYLTTVCPVDANSRLSTELEDRIVRVMEKRREYLDSAPDSAPRPVSAPAISVPHPSSTSFSLSPALKEIKESGDSTPVHTPKPVLKPNSNPNPSTNPYELYDSRLATASVRNPFLLETPSRNVQNRNPKVRVSPRKRGRTSVPAGFSVRQSNTNFKVSQSYNFSPSPSASDRKHPSTFMNKAATRIQAWWRGIRTRTKDAQVVGVRAEIRYRRLEAWMEADRKRLDETSETKAMTELMRRLETDRKEWKTEMEELRNKYQKLEMALASLIPFPIDLKFAYRDSESGILSWDLKKGEPTVTGFRVYVDGELCGAVSSGRRRTLITDLEPNKTHRIEMESNSSFGLDSKRSEECTIGNYCPTIATVECPLYESSSNEHEAEQMFTNEYIDHYWTHWTTLPEERARTESKSDSSESKPISRRLKARFPSVERPS